jgi:hypothetical protein
MNLTMIFIRIVLIALFFVWKVVKGVVWSVVRIGEEHEGFFSGLVAGIFGALMIIGGWGALTTSQMHWLMRLAAVLVSSLLGGLLLFASHLGFAAEFDGRADSVGLEWDHIPWRLRKERDDQLSPRSWLLGLTSTSLILVGLPVAFHFFPKMSLYLLAGFLVLVLLAILVTELDTKTAGKIRRQQIEHKNLRNWNLSGRNLSGIDLSEFDMSGSYMRKTDLTGANLSKANLRRAELVGAVLRDANLTGADLSGAIMTGADLRGTNLSGTDLSNTNLNVLRLSVGLSALFLDGVKYDRQTKWPNHFEPSRYGATLKENSA